ncbi:hypothetical protein NEPAR06_1102 [Nematocida parisii]|uniref:FAD/NAD(P)-binding domain-containing protein n=1 Tax=Nematocida parisii (strain ERTm3) TaxID=935791 RepID=I3EII6_NEMP3|nr:uncharacterized protein NEPG_01754 [Nematocida parisii ERTm1]EIJ89033.1 hypothetical protein NEQG_00852 [Nematocida parisii ERTm3]KAI5125972.1 hypothetical protein NEPAR08_0308 [Nematocida parisii]EIJ93412.1 hypothetical protein NEPG_01754 [Nematocida parisii ERTm1]KAI5126237.1 hypothetical protein NEPAR03_0409 [Nematocida parisii]KAI5140482.1 hypothetical protein NEPAR04_0314 [Nematocida parisii]|eukprot:XP_013059582.1 hypothetical protein NEPG_01754 [Nematocida parisii ERTm1]
MKVFDIVIIGRNISAMTAAIYAAMSKSNTLYISPPTEKGQVTGVNKYVGYLSGDYENFRMSTYKQLKKFDIPESDFPVERIMVEDEYLRIFTDEEILAKTVIISTDDVLEKVEGDNNSKMIFKCGNLINNQTEMIALAGTGCMAAMDARTFISEHK